MNVLLIDDHALFREGLAMLLATLLPPHAVWQAESCEQAFALMDARGAPELALVDLALPGLPGLDGLATLRERWPQTVCVAVSSADDRDTVLRAIDAGAMGFIPKSASSSTLHAALRVVLSGAVYLPPAAFLGGGGTASRPARSGRVTPADIGLTPRQADVLRLILQGMPAKLIERKLNLSQGTVKTHTAAVLRTLNVTSRTQAVVEAGRLGLRFDDEISPPPPLVAR